MKKTSHILENPMIKKALNNFKAKGINEKLKLKTQIGAQLIARIQEELLPFTKRRLK